MKRFGRGLFILLFLTTLGKGTPAGAYSTSSDSTAQGEEEEKADSFADNDMNNDDATDETGTNFKEDSDDTYEDHFADEEDDNGSRFKAERDGDDADTAPAGDAE